MTWLDQRRIARGISVEPPARHPIRDTRDSLRVVVEPHPRIQTPAPCGCDEARRRRSGRQPCTPSAPRRTRDLTILPFGSDLPSIAANPRSSLTTAASRPDRRSASPSDCSSVIPTSSPPTMSPDASSPETIGSCQDEPAIRERELGLPAPGSEAPRPLAQTEGDGHAFLSSAPSPTLRLASWDCIAQPSITSLAGCLPPIRYVRDDMRPSAQTAQLQGLALDGPSPHPPGHRRPPS